MPSLDFDAEKAQFREFYGSNQQLLENSKNSFVTLVNSLLTHAGSIAISKVEGRVKDREECIKKFNLKYRSDLELKLTPYAIKDCITDLIGLRVVCLYEDDVEKVESCLSDHFEVVSKTDKISQFENSEDSFGYKGLHLDLRLNDTRKRLPEYAKCSDFSFEIQIRTIIQDSWSVLDHKIKYKKSIPTKLKRRINTLAALFELADREFREIRDSTKEEIEKEEISEAALQQETDASQNNPEAAKNHVPTLNAFSFLKIAEHFFLGYEFEPHKTDGFTQEILNMKPDITRGKFNFYMRTTISKVKRYQSYFEKENKNDTLNPYTVIRHCLYLGDKNVFAPILTTVAKESFEAWLRENEH